MIGILVEEMLQKIQVPVFGRRQNLKKTYTSFKNVIRTKPIFYFRFAKMPLMTDTHGQQLMTDTHGQQLMTDTHGHRPMFVNE